MYIHHTVVPIEKHCVLNNHLDKIASQNGANVNVPKPLPHRHIPKQTTLTFVNKGV